jgi:hypothetical protein
MPHLEENVRALNERLGSPLLGVVPFRPGATAAEVGGLLGFDALIEATT